MSSDLHVHAPSVRKVGFEKHAKITAANQRTDYALNVCQKALGAATGEGCGDT